MKTKIKSLATLMLASALLLFAGCTEKDDDGSGNETGTDIGTGTGTGTETDDTLWVDLGLPSGLLWASCNIGAAAPEEYGDYFAWGETLPKEVYNWNTYSLCNSSYSQLTKYCNKSSFGYNGYTDNLTILEAIDDAATQALGGGARIPTVDEWSELNDNTTSQWFSLNGTNGRVYGKKFTAANGNSIFLPASGYHWGSGAYTTGSQGDYWSSSLYTDTPSAAWYINLFSNGQVKKGCDRYHGLSVRAVRQK